MKKSVCMMILIMAVLFNCFSAFNVSAAVFDENTNMAGWRGLESGWTSTSSGYKDGSEQTVFDVAVSDVTVDGSKNFTYTVHVKKESGYGAGIALGIKDPSSRDAALQNFVYFIADGDGSVYYRVYKDGAEGDPVGRTVTDTEDVSDFTMTVKYNALAGTASFFLDDLQVSALADVSAITGTLGLISHDAEALFQSAIFTEEDAVEKEPVKFTTNMTGWKGIESTWTETEAYGYMDGTEQSMNDFAFSDVYVDANKSFIYSCKMQRISGYGLGLAYGVQDISSRDAVLSSYTRFIVDTQSVTYSINESENVGRRLTDEELDPSVDGSGDAIVYKLDLEYVAEEGVAYLYINDILFESYYAEENIEGYLGLLAHDARISVISADFQYVGEDAATEEPSEAPSDATEVPAATQTAETKGPTQTPAAAKSHEAGEGDDNNDSFSGIVIAVVIAAICIAAAIAAVIIFKRRKK